MNKTNIYDILNQMVKLSKSKLGKKKSKEFDILYNQLLECLDESFQEYDRLHNTIDSINNILKEDN